jgi:hypothetical protein
MVVHICNPRYAEGRSRRIVVLGQYLAKISTRPYLKNALK